MTESENPKRFNYKAAIDAIEYTDGYLLGLWSKEIDETICHALQTMLKYQKQIERLERGGVVVPREPTGAMWSAGTSQFRGFAAHYHLQDSFKDQDVIVDIAATPIYKAMIAAAQETAHGNSPTSAKTSAEKSPQLDNITVETIGYGENGSAKEDHRCLLREGD